MQQQHPLTTSVSAPDHMTGLQYHHPGHVSSAPPPAHTDYSAAPPSVSVDPYVSQASAAHHAVAAAAGSVSASPADFPPSAAMYVNTVWGAEHQAPSSHPSQSHVYYEAGYPGAAAAAAMYGYPGHILPGQEGHVAYPGMHQQPPAEGGKRKRRRVISYEQRKAANVRERKRMCHLNDAFDVLRKRVPTFAYEKKLSRIETLKLAVTYIQYMAELLDDIEDKKGKGSPASTDSGNSSIKTELSPTSSNGGVPMTEHDYRTSDVSLSPSSASSTAE